MFKRIKKYFNRRKEFEAKYRAEVARLFKRVDCLEGNHEWVVGAQYGAELWIASWARLTGVPEEAMQPGLVQCKNCYAHAPMQAVKGKRARK